MAKVLFIIAAVCFCLGVWLAHQRHQEAVALRALVVALERQIAAQHQIIKALERTASVNEKMVAIYRSQEGTPR